MKMAVTSLFGVFHEAPGGSARSVRVLTWTLLGTDYVAVVKATILSGSGPLRTDVIIRQILLKNDVGPTKNQQISPFCSLAILSSRRPVQKQCLTPLSTHGQRPPMFV